MFVRAARIPARPRFARSALRYIALVLACVPGPIPAMDAAASGPDASESASVPGASEVQIRDARARFNAAIENGDAGAMGGLFGPNYHGISGRGDPIDGAAAHIGLWRKTFRDNPGFNCQRSPEDVTVNENWGLAQESGSWVCTQTVEGNPSRYSGVFAAKWQRSTSGDWLLLSEVFTTLDCSGPEAACRRPDPVEVAAPAD